MARPYTFSVEVESLNRLLGEMRQDDPIYGARWRQRLQRGTLAAEAEAKRVAPGVSGRLLLLMVLLSLLLALYYAYLMLELS